MTNSRRPKFSSLALLFFLVLGGCASTENQDRGPIACEIVAYGEIDEIPDDRILGSMEGDSDKLLGKVGSGMKLSSRGANVRARLGSGFGVVHKFTGGREKQAINVVLTHPPIDYGNGATTETRWSKPAASQGTTFFFDLGAELIPGTWSFAFIDSETEVCRQTFSVELST